MNECKCCGYKWEPRKKGIVSKQCSKCKSTNKFGKLIMFASGEIKSLQEKK